MSMQGCVVLAEALSKTEKERSELLEAAKLSKEILKAILPVLPGNNEPIVSFIETLEILIKKSDRK